MGNPSLYLEAFGLYMSSSCLLFVNDGNVGVFRAKNIRVYYIYIYTVQVYDIIGFFAHYYDILYVLRVQQSKVLRDRLSEPLNI